MDYGNNQFNQMTEVGVGEWVLSYLIMMIPCIGLIMSIVWAFSNNTKPSKRNFFRAYLILAVIMTAIVGGLYGILIVAGILANA